MWCVGRGFLICGLGVARQNLVLFEMFGRNLMEFFNIGFGNMVSLQRIVSILNSDSSPVKRLVRLAKDKEKMIDASCGRKTQSVLVMDTGHVILSALSSDAIQNKLSKCEEMVYDF